VARSQRAREELQFLTCKQSGVSEYGKCSDVQTLELTLNTEILWITALGRSRAQEMCPISSLEAFINEWLSQQSLGRSTLKNTAKVFFNFSTLSNR